ncbi:EamA-like transporter family protein [compost metagenome]
MVYFKLINEGEAGKVGSFTFLIPLISIGASVVLLNEQITPNLIVGMLLIVSSIILVNVRLGRRGKRLKSLGRGKEPRRSAG